MLRHCVLRSGAPPQSRGSSLAQLVGKLGRPRAIPRAGVCAVPFLLLTSIESWSARGRPHLGGLACHVPSWAGGTNRVAPHLRLIMTPLVGGICWFVRLLLRILASGARTQMSTTPRACSQNLACLTARAVYNG